MCKWEGHSYTLSHVGNAHYVLTNIDSRDKTIIGNRACWTIWSGTHSIIMQSREMGGGGGGKRMREDTGSRYNMEINWKEGERERHRGERMR